MASDTRQEVTAAKGAAGLELLIKEIDKLVSLPDIYYRLESAIADPTSSNDAIAKLLASDADLCARLLRMANSAFFGFPTKIESIDRAVNTIGLRQLRELVLVTEVVKAFNGIPKETVNMSQFWEHSIAVGIMARALAKHAGMPNSDSFYIPGLLHDIGRLVMYLKLPGLMLELLQQREQQGKALFELEKDCLGYSHADIGGSLLEFWKLPQSIYQPVVEHHDPQQDDEFGLIGCGLHLADYWINANRLGSSGVKFETVLNAEVMSMLDIDDDDLDEVGLLAEEQMREVLRQFLNH